ncbi:unnamed protein product [Trichogramma brassicae]|uniref:Prefoldin subunit 1 n=1 Tax=Trichogramma brassicae TaxID=86971 RepID=A0A6H5HZB4_9HYME|nr:unnamed protein product [Trichogramma brassicae]
MAKIPDEELKKAFSELHNKVVSTRQLLKVADMQIENINRHNLRVSLTRSELKQLPENTKTYESVGRMFLLQDMNTIMEDLDKRTKLADGKIKALNNQKTYLQKDLKESEDNIREMVQKRQKQDS